MTTIDDDMPRTRGGGMLLLRLLGEFGWRVRVRRDGGAVGLAERDGLRVTVRGRTVSEVVVRLYAEALLATSGHRAAQAA
ncbi:MAG TPA: hypothetical protein VMU66_01305 [Gaiellales bacterium]|nr:hypothetical protein [Gaiellales bacterium]